MLFNFYEPNKDIRTQKNRVAPVSLWVLCSSWRTLRLICVVASHYGHGNLEWGAGSLSRGNQRTCASL